MGDWHCWVFGVFFGGRGMFYLIMPIVLKDSDASAALKPPHNEIPSTNTGSKSQNEKVTNEESFQHWFRLAL